MSEANSTTQVEYRPIEGYPGYRVGSDGSVWSCRKRGRISGIGATWRRLSLSHDTNGYPFVGLSTGCGQSKQINVHRLVLLAFKGPCPDGMEAAHENGIKTDNRPSNLFWKTHVANMDDLDKHGNKPSKLSAAQVKAILAQAGDGKLSLPQIAALHNVGIGAVRAIVRGVTWKRQSGGKRINRKTVYKKGEDHPHVKLTMAQVEEIRRTPKCWGSEAALARKFGVNPVTIHYARTGRTWSSIS